MKKHVIILILSVIIGGCSSIHDNARYPSSSNSFLDNCVGSLNRFFTISNSLSEKERKIVEQFDQMETIEDLKDFQKEMSSLNVKRIRAILENSKLVESLNLDHIDKDFYTEMIKSGSMTNENFDLLGFPTKKKLTELKAFRKIGVEIEGAIEDPVNNTYKVVANKIKKFYDSKGRYAEVDKEYTYNISREYEYGESAKNTFETYSSDNLSLYKIRTKYDRTLEVKFDETLVGTPENSYGIEITSPIMSRHRDVELFEELITRLESMNIHSFVERGGVHVHIDAKGILVGQYKRMLKKFLEEKKKLYDRFKPVKTRGLQDYFITKQLNLLETYDNNLTLDKVDKIIFYNRGPIAYSPNHKTIEFRLFNSTTDVDEIKEMVQFSLDFVEENSASD